MALQSPKEQIQHLIDTRPPHDLFPTLCQHYPEGHPPEDVLDLVIDFYKKYPYSHTLQRDSPATWIEPEPAPALLWCRRLNVRSSQNWRIFQAPNTLDILNTLFASPYVANIEALTIDGYHLRDDQLPSLGSHMPKLQTLDVHSTELTHEGIQNISRGITTPKIRTLYLSAKTIGLSGIRAIHHAPLFQPITRLGMGSIIDPYETFEAIIETGLSRKLTQLDIGNVRYDLEDASVLLRPEAWPNLKEIFAYTDGNTSMSTYQQIKQWSARHHITTTSY